MKNLIKRRNIFLVGIAAVFVLILIFLVQNAGGREVEMEKLDVGPVRDIIEEEAQVTSRMVRNVSTLVNGTVEAIRVQVGDAVHEDDVLAQMDTTDIDNQLSIATDELDALKYAFEDALQPNDKETIRQYESAYNTAVISRDSAKNSFEKNEQLFNEGAISSQTLSDSKAAYDLAQENVNRSYQALVQVRKGLSDALKNKFASEIKAKETMIEMLGLEKERHLIKTAADGVVLSKFIEAGDYITLGMTTFEVGDTGQIYFKSDILDSDVANIRVGTPVIIHLNDSVTADAKVTKIFPKAETQISDLGIEQKRVRVEIDTETDVDALEVQVLLGQELDIEFVKDMRDNVLRLREDLTYMKDGKYFVFVEDEGRAVERQIETGLIGDTYIEVLSGLAESDWIIVPNDDLEPNAKVIRME